MKVKVTQVPWTAAKVMKNINFGIARGLTKTAKEGQSAVVDALKGAFTLRGTWFQQSNKFGIKVKPAKPNDLQAAVWTMADWLEPHETGKDKQGSGHRIAVPQWAIRRRGSTMKITSAKKARRLLAAGKAFLLQTHRGEVIATQKGRGDDKRLVVLYGLESRVRIKKRSTFYEPIQKVVLRNCARNINASMADALNTMR